MLQGNVHVRNGVRRHGLKELVLDAVRLEVEQTQPVGSRIERRQLGEQAAHPAPARLRPARRVLPYEDDLPRPGRERGVRSAQYVTGKNRLVVALDERDGAEGATAVTPVGDLDIGAHGSQAPWHGSREGGLVTARDVAGLLPRLRRCGERGQQRGSVQPAPDVDFGQLGRQFVAVALDETTDGGDA